MTPRADPVAPEPPGESATASASSPPRGPVAYKRLWILATLVFVADQASKEWIVHRMPFPTFYGDGRAIEVIRDFLYLIHVGNTGAAWSLFTGKSFLLAALAAATLVGIFLWRRALALHDRTVQISFGLLCGGILGNLVDRLRHGHVIDFLDFHFGSYQYPTFNVADSGICVGVGIYLIWSLRQPADPGNAKPGAPAA